MDYDSNVLTTELFRLFLHVLQLNIFLSYLSYNDKRNEALKNKAWSAAVNAEVSRGKAAGLYIEQKIIRTGKLDDLSEEELDRRLAEVLDQYSPILEGVEVEELKSDVKQKQTDIRIGKPQQPTKKEKILVDYSLSSSSSSKSSSKSESESQS